MKDRRHSFPNPRKQVNARARIQFCVPQSLTHSGGIDVLSKTLGDTGNIPNKETVYNIYKVHVHHTHRKLWVCSDGDSCLCCGVRRSVKFSGAWNLGPTILTTILLLNTTYSRWAPFRLNTKRQAALDNEQAFLSSRGSETNCSPLDLIPGQQLNASGFCHRSASVICTRKPTPVPTIPRFHQGCASLFMPRRAMLQSTVLISLQIWFFISCNSPRQRQPLVACA